MYAKNESYSSSQSRDIHVKANLAKHPPEDPKHSLIENYFDYSNVRVSHTFIKNITFICLKLIYK